ncbi:MAG: hypothetical protein ACRERU_23140 [Methylococcales bacterium]
MNISRFQHDRQTQYLPNPGRRLEDFEFIAQLDGMECSLFELLNLLVCTMTQVWLYIEQV